jgi:glycosyltransferase involved in cell wall biosynthesis
MTAFRPLPSLSVLIPAYRDEDTIGTVVERARAAAMAVADRFEIVVVNDASPDDTAGALVRIGESVPELRVITHAHNLGYGATIRELYYAGRYDWLFTAPGDFQVDPLELLTLVPFASQADMVIGWRQDRNDAAARKRQSAVYNSLVRMLYGTPFRDVNSVRLMRRSALPVRLRSASAFVDAELAIRLWRAGKRTVEAPISHRARQSGEGGGGKLSVILPTFTDLVRFRLLGFS